MHRTSIAVLAAVFSLSALAQTNGRSYHGHAMPHSSDAARTPFDLQFIDTMIVHHQGAIDMAKLAETRAASPELKELAAGMVFDQAREIGQLQDWRTRWYGGRAAAINMSMPGMAESMMDMDMNKLAATSGREFDLMFIEQMSRYHDGAIAMARQAQRQAGRDEIRSLARAIIVAQDSEIAQMAKWKKQWQKPGS